VNCVCQKAQECEVSYFLFARSLLLVKVRWFSRQAVNFFSFLLKDAKKNFFGDRSQVLNFVSIYVARYLLDLSSSGYNEVTWFCKYYDELQDDFWPVEQLWKVDERNVTYGWNAASDNPKGR
jgi:hypothetical protein